MKNHVSYPEGNVLLRNLNKSYPVISHGSGVYLFDLDGKNTSMLLAAHWLPRSVMETKNSRNRFLIR
jgi:hypothetical protein